MSAHGKQAAQLTPVTALVVTESTRVILGLKNFGVFWVFLAFMVTSMGAGFLPGVVLAAGTFLFVRTQIDAKPRHHLRHTLAFRFVWPRRFRHRPCGGDAVARPAWAPRGR